MDNTLMEEERSREDIDGGKFLTFALKNEDYGIEILKVREIIGIMEITSVPQTLSYLKGVINLRGVIVPIVDLRQRLDSKQQEYGATTVVIVMRAIVANNEIVVGLVVDAVSEVYKVSSAKVKPAPDFGSRGDCRFLTGMATIDNKIIILMDYMKLLDVDSLYDISKMAVAG